MTKFLQTAIKAAKESEKALQNGLGTSVAAENKNHDQGLADWVTDYDLLSEKAIITTIRNIFPDHTILSEEGLSKNKNSEYVWIIDPLDGTTNFSRNIPHFSVSIALQKNNELIAAVVNLPSTKELYSAEKNEGAFLNEKKIIVSDNSEPESSLIGLSMARTPEGQKIGLETLKKIMGIPVKPRVFGSVASDLARVASGQLDGIVFNNLNAWDVAAGILLVEEAGGKVTEVTGEKYDLNNKQIIASNGLLHNKIVNALNK